jgi:anti-sigma factor RsiW
MRHPDESELIDYVRGDIGDTERAALTAHVATCTMCRDSAAGIRHLLDTLTAATAPPAVHWGRYRAALREKLERRKPPAAGTTWWRPVSAALAATLAIVLVVLAVSGVPRESQVAAVPPPEDSAVLERLDLLQQYTMLERLDLIEDLEVIGTLDDLPDES